MGALGPCLMWLLAVSKYYCAVPIVRHELRQQLEKLSASNKALKSSNKTLTDDVARLSQAQHTSDVRMVKMILVMYVRST